MIRRLSVPPRRFVASLDHPKLDHLIIHLFGHSPGKLIAALDSLKRALNEEILFAPMIQRTGEKKPGIMPQGTASPGSAPQTNAARTHRDSRWRHLKSAVRPASSAKDASGERLWATMDLASSWVRALSFLPYHPGLAPQHKILGIAKFSLVLMNKKRSIQPTPHCRYDAHATFRLVFIVGS